MINKRHEQIKVCKKCNQNYLTWSNRALYCLNCRKDIRRNYWSRPERVRYNLLWEARNKERRKKYRKVYYADPKIKLRQKTYQKDWRARNIEHERNYRKTIGKQNNIKYRLTFKGRTSSRLNVEKRLARLRNIKHNFTRQDWMAKLIRGKGFCQECNQFIGIRKLQLDHIYPVKLASEDYQRTGVKKSYGIEDIQPLCQKCNRKKSDKIEMVIKTTEMKK